MYFISSDYDIPDIGYAEERVREIMCKGIYVRDISDKLKKFSQMASKASGDISAIYGVANPRSAKQWAEFLEEQADPDIAEACYDENKESWTTNKYALEGLVHKGYGFATDLLAYRKMASYESAIKQLMENMDSRRVLRPEVNRGVTNRFHYRNPGLMSIPKKLVWEVISPRHEGNVLFSIDIKNQEPWIMINMLGIESLRDRLSSENKDGLYNMVSMDILGREPSETERIEIKRAWNAMSYGASKAGILNMCKNTDGNAIYKYFNSFKEFKDYKQKCVVMGKRKVQTVETYFGSEVSTDELGSRLWRVLMDLPIQGTGADILALLIQHFDEEVEKRDLGEAMEFYFSRHDEVIIEVSRDYYDALGIDEVTNVLRDIFAHSVDDWEPFTVEIKVLNGFEVDGSYVLDDEDEE